MSLTQIIIGLIIVILFAIGIIISISNVIFRYKKRKYEDEIFLRVQRRRQIEKEEDLVDLIDKEKNEK